MFTYSPAWPHSSIIEVFPEIFFVTGTNITQFQGMNLQHRRNMVIVKRNNALSLINTVRLDHDGLAALDALGAVKNVIRIGAFHGRDDAFYLDKYSAKLWAIKGMEHAQNRATDMELKPGGQMPFSGSSFFLFETSQCPEGVFHFDQNGGILITCDSIKNWLAPDSFFDDATAKLYQQQGFFGTASVSSIWKQATQVQSTDFQKLMTLPFQHLISAHGVPLLNKAKEKVANSVMF